MTLRPSTLAKSVELQQSIIAAYETTAEQLRDRILALIPKHPEILEMNDCFKLFGVQGFHCDDLKPSLAQAGWAMRSAQRLYRKAKDNENERAE